MFERPAESIWNLTVHEATLAFIAPHGTFPVLDLPSAVASIVSSLPTGTEVRCRCTGRNVRELRVLEVVGLETNLTKHAGDLPDAVIALDSRLMLERARLRIESGNVASAVEDLGKALRAGHDGVLDVLDRFPAGSEKPLLADLATWAQPRPVNWRALRHLPLAQWTSRQVQSAFDASLKTAGRFGTDPGIGAEDLLAELARRGSKTESRKEKLARLRRASATETDGIHRLAVDIENARVVGACERGVYVAAGRTLYLFTMRGRELARWKVLADRVVGDVALLIDAGGGLAPVSRAIRLSDGNELFTFEWIERHDHELVCGATGFGPWGEARQTRYEVRRITGERVVDLGDLGHDHEVWWDRERIYIVMPKRGQTIDRTTGAIVATSAPTRAETVDVHTQSGKITVDAAQTIWRLGRWDDRVGGGWQVCWNRQRTLALAPTEPGAAWSLVDLAVRPASVDIAPPWLVVYRNEEPILLLPLASLARAEVLHLNAKWFARPSERTPVATLSRAVETWCAALVEAGIAPPPTPDVRTALFELFPEPSSRPKSWSLARALRNWSPHFIEHDPHAVEPEFWSMVTDLYADEGIAFEEISRAPAGNSGARVTFRARRGDRVEERACEPLIDSLIGPIDAMARALGSRRSMYPLEGDAAESSAYLAITREQRKKLAAARIAGICEEGDRDAR